MALVAGGLRPNLWYPFFYKQSARTTHLALVPVRSYTSTSCAHGHPHTTPREPAVESRCMAVDVVRRMGGRRGVEYDRSRAADRTRRAANRSRGGVLSEESVLSLERPVLRNIVLGTS